MLEFRLFGQFDVRVNGQPLTIPSRLAQSLLAYLLVNRTTQHRRERLAGLFWPDTSETKARGSLRQELWRIRKAIDAVSLPHSDLLWRDDLSVGVDPHAEYRLDVAVLEGLVTANPSTDDLMRALDVYQGDLLPDFYDEWAAPERERLRALFEQQTKRLLDQLHAEQRWGEMLTWSELWIARARSPEPAFRALMVAHNALGNRSQVAAVFERCAAALKDDLGVEPSEQTRALFEQLSKAEGGRLYVVGGDLEPGGTIPPTAFRLPLTADGLPPTAFRLPASSFILHPSSLNSDPPYKGLRYFDEGDADLFFGRERLVATLVSHLDQHHWLTVVGASGSGKSSVVRAGLVPMLKRAEKDDRSPWDIRILTPTPHPLEALAISLIHSASSLLTTTTLMDDLARDSRALRVYAHSIVPEGTCLLLVIDQFEELFTLCREETERQAFIDNLLLATAPELDRAISVVVALRADFYAHAAHYANLREALSRRQEYIGSMTAAEMRQAIEGPAAQGGWELESGLAELILRDVGTEPGALPLLSHALLETWQRRRERTLTLEGYATSGGVRGAIAQTAETVFHQLSPDGQKLARHIFLQLTELGEGTQDTRRRVTCEELVPPQGNAAAVRGVLDKLAEARLVSLSENSVEVAHEALIREWPTLREWLSQNREGLRLHRRLSEAAQAWQKSNRDEGELYRGARLAQVLEWAKGRTAELNPLEQEFIDASKDLQAREEAEREAQRQRELVTAQKLAEAERRRANVLRGAAIGSTLLLVVMIGLALFAFSQRTAAENARAEAVTQRDAGENERRTAFVRELSVNAVNNLAIDPERSILLALQAVSVSTAGGQSAMREAEEALHRAVQASRVQLTLRGHTGGLRNIAYSPDGKRLATASDDKSAKVWDAATGQELLTLCCHEAVVYGIAYSPDGGRLATSSTDKTAKIWDAATGQELLTLRGHTDAIRGIAFSPDGTRVATGSYDRTAKVWDAQTGKELLTLVGNTGGIVRVAFSPDGTRLATGSYSDDPEHTAKVWDATTGQVLLTLKGHTNIVYSLAFSPDGKRLATASGDGTAKVWDSISGQLLMNLFVHGQALGVAFDPGGTRLATGAADGTAKVWDAATGELLLTLAGHMSQVNLLSFNPDGTRLATSSTDGTAKIWDITPAGSREWLTLAGHERAVYDMAYSPDGSRLASASLDKTAKIWDAQTGQLLLTLSGHTSDIAGVTFSPDGKRVATESIDQTARVWDVATGKQLLSISTAIFPFNFGLHPAFSPDGKRIATPGAGNSAKLWDAATGQELLTLCCQTSYVRGIAFSPDGTRLATSGFDGTAKVWDAATGKELHTLSGHKSMGWWVAFSPDGGRIATASSDGTAKVWDAATGKELLTLSGHTGGVNSAAFSPDGSRVATASADGTAKIWDVSTSNAPREQPLTLYDPTGAGFANAVFSRDGQRLAAASNDGAVRIYALPPEDIVSIAQSRVTRTLTQDECRKYLHVEQCPMP